MIFFKKDQMWDSIWGLKGYMFDLSNLKKYAKIGRSFKTLCQAKEVSPQKSQIVWIHLCEVQSKQTQRERRLVAVEMGEEGLGTDG